MFSFLPSLLSTWQLPGLAAGALSSALQRRILSYLLKKTLGHLIKDNSINLDQIDANSLGGKIEIRNVHLDAAAVSDLLPNLPCRLDSGLVGSISVQLPWPNIRSGDLAISISNLSLRVALDRSAQDKENLDVRESLASLAEESLHQDPDGLELEQSIQASVLEETSAAASTNEVPANGYITSIVEGLLARLKLSVKDLRVNIYHEIDESIEVQLRIETALAETTIEEELSIQSIIRSATVQGFELYLCNKKKSPDSTGAADDDDDSDDESRYMAMSQAITDLRSSHVASASFLSTKSGGESLYASALGVPLETSRSPAQPSTCSEEIKDTPQEQLLLRTDGETIRASLTVTSKKGDEDDDSEEEDAVEGDYSPLLMRANLDFDVGSMVSFLTPASLKAILRFSTDCISIFQSEEDAGRVPSSSSQRSTVKGRADVDVQARCKGVDIVCAYEDAVCLGDTLLKEYQESLDAYWTKPSKVHPQIGHLRLRVQDWKYTRFAHTTGAPSSVEMMVGDIALYEHLSPLLVHGKSNAAPMLPIIIFDHCLEQQYTTVRRSNMRGQRNQHRETKAEEVIIDCIDWRLPANPTDPAQSNSAGQRGSPYWRTNYGDRGWKVRPKHRRSSSHATASAASDGPVLTATTEVGGLVKIALAPIHFFVDLSTIDRMMPLLLSVGKTVREDIAESMRSESTASFETLHQETKGNSRIAGDGLRQVLTLECSLVRMELRVPSSAPQRHLRGHATRSRRLIGLDVRAGILIIDAQHVKARMGSETCTPSHATVQFSTVGQSAARPSERPQQQAVCSLNSISAFYKEVSEQRATSFAVFGMIASDEEESAEPPLPPQVRLLRRKTPAHEDLPRSFVECFLPSLSLRVSKALLDGLELIADDFNLWTTALKGDDDDEMDQENATDALKILGSRFFGTKHSVSALSGSSASVELVRKSDAIPAFSLQVNDIVITLLVPRKRNTEESRKLCLKVSDLQLFLDTRHGPRSTLVDAKVLNFTLEDETDSGRKRCLIARTLTPSLSKAFAPLLSVHLLSTSDAETTSRESRCEVLIQALTATFDGDKSLLNDLLVFSRSPEGAFEHVEPNEVTRLSLRLHEVSICVAPQDCDANAVALIGDLSIRTKLKPDARQTSIRVHVQDTFILLCEKKSQGEGPERDRLARTASEYWTGEGFAKAVSMTSVSASVMLSTLTKPEVDIKTSKVVVEVLACADTMQIVQTLMQHLVPEPIAHEKGTSSRSSSLDGQEINKDLLVSLDENAFRRARTLSSIPDLLEDDVPRHPEYFSMPAGEETTKHFSTFEDEVGLSEDEAEREETCSSALLRATPSRLADVVLRNETVTVRLLDSKGIVPKANYLTTLQSIPKASQASQQNRSPSLRVRIQGCDVIIRMYAGYDCPSTRNAVEEEVKRVKRRLQKIKQMLDQGQTPDDSVEEATAQLMESVHIALPRGAAAADLEANEMMQAMDDELGGDGESETASSASTWKQFIPGRSGPASNERPYKKKKKSKLARSKRSLIDIEFKGVTVEYDQYSPKELRSSRLLLQARTLQILDNVKTSTWKTFLTGMAPRQATLPRHTTDMVKMELIHVRPAAGAETEVRCRARLSPLRLHVDQDALDFLKKFGAFRAPNSPPDAPVPANARSQPFIQHAEVFPVRIKLDYKPKRVDYNLLREGKTIEMMNFFNFEGSEMTLRHVTIRGVSGWPRFFDTLQDIWTPDVKSNQLADVLSGISPIRSLVNVGNGVADLILLPIEQYQRDGNLGKGVKAGAKSFVKSTMLEAARIGARLATGTQVILEQAESVLAGKTGRPGGMEAGETSSGGDYRKRVKLEMDEDEEDLLVSESDEEGSVARISRYANQPGNLRQALSEAQQDMQRGLNSAAQTILAVPMEVYERQSGEGGSRPVIRAVPIAVLKGAAGASGAVGKTLQGIQRELAGASLEEEEDKYKKGTGPRGQELR